MSVFSKTDDDKVKVIEEERKKLEGERGFWDDTHWTTTIKTAIDQLE